MQLWEIFLIGVSLSMDAFAVAVCKGLTLCKVKLSHAVIVGLYFGIFQALTQIQEMTLAFVPKIICVFLALILLFPFMFSQMQTLSDTLFSKISGG